MALAVSQWEIFITNNRDFVFNNNLFVFSFCTVFYQFSQLMRNLFLCL